MLKDQVYALKMDDSIKAMVGLALQKDSEFLQIFNHYILRGLEFGEFKRQYRDYHQELFTKENFQMPEPQPLVWSNVMFCFICLGLGVCLSLIIAMMELMTNAAMEKTQNRWYGKRNTAIRQD